MITWTEYADAPKFEIYQEGNCESSSQSDLTRDLEDFWRVLAATILQHSGKDWDTIVIGWQPSHGRLSGELQIGVDSLTSWKCCDVYFEALHDRLESSDDVDLIAVQMTEMILAAVSSSLRSNNEEDFSLRAVLDYDTQLVVIEEVDEPPIFRTLIEV